MESSYKFCLLSCFIILIVAVFYQLLFFCFVSVINVVCFFRLGLFQWKTTVISSIKTACCMCNLTWYEMCTRGSGMDCKQREEWFIVKLCMLLAKRFGIDSPLTLLKLDVILNNYCCFFFSGIGDVREHVTWLVGYQTKQDNICWKLCKQVCCKFPFWFLLK